MRRAIRVVGTLVWVLCGCNSPSTGSVQSTVDVPAAAAPDDVQQTDDGPDVSPPDSAVPPTVPPNILLIIADDIGVEASQCYDVGADLAPTPHIQSLCARGVVFENMWSAPTCSPTRAGLLTGRYSYRTGVGDVILAGAPGLSLDEWAIPRVLDANPQLGYSHACIGKWHLAPPGQKTHPNDMGFSYFSGLLIGGVQSYTQWKETTDGVTATNTQYATSRHVDLAIDWVDAQQSPWFLWLALISPHTPVHLPPDGLHTYSELSGTEADITANSGPYFRAMIQAMDTEIGRLFAGIGEDRLANTVVIYVGDNGTSGKIIEAPYDNTKSKGSLYQGGVHVPFVVAGPGVNPTSGRTAALTHVVDIYATILDLAGVDSTTVPADVAVDGASLVPILQGSQATVHDWVLTELFGASGPNKAGQAVRDDTYKLIRHVSGLERFFDLASDPYELSPLDTAALEPAALTGYQTLSAILDDINAQ